MGGMKQKKTQQNLFIHLFILFLNTYLPCSTKYVFIFFEYLPFMFDIKIAIKIKNDILMKIVNKERYIVNMVWNKVVEKKKMSIRADKHHFHI